MEGRCRNIFLAAFAALAAMGVFCGGRSAYAEAAAEVIEQHRQVVVFGADSEYPPFSFIDKRGQPAGYTIEVIRAIGVVMGFDVRFEMASQEHILNGLDEGRIHVAAVFRGTERDERMNFSAPLMVRYYIIVVRRDEEVFTTLEDLAGREVILQAGSYAHDHMLADSRGATLVTAETEADALRLLASGRHDAAIVSNISSEFLVRRHKLDNLVMTGPPVIARRYCFGVAKDKGKLVYEINEGLSVIRQTGEYETIYNEWIRAVEPGYYAAMILRYAAIALIPLGVILGAVVLWTFALRRQVRLRTAELRQEIIDRKAAQEKARASEEGCRPIFDAVNDAIFVQEMDTGKVIDCNEKVQEMYGYSPEEARGIEILDISSGEYPYGQEQILQWVHKAAKEGPQLFEWMAKHKDGYLFWVEVNLRMAVVGGKRRILAVVRDINERKEAERRLEMLSRAVAEASNGIIMTEHHGKDNPIIYVNSAFEKITGYSAAEALGQDCRFLQGEDRDQPALEEIRKSIREGNSCRVSLRNYRKDGGLFWNELNISPVKNDNGKVTHHIGIMSDITEIKRASDALRESESRYRAVVEDQTELITRCEKDTTLTFVNQACCRYLGKPANELIGRRFLEFIPAGEVGEIEKHIASLNRNKQVGSVEHYLKRADGQWRRFLWTNRMLFDEAGEFAGYQGVGRDITDRRLAEEEISTLAMFPDENPNPVIRVSGEGKVLYSNKAASQDLKVGAEQTLPGKWYSYVQEALESQQICLRNVECDGRIFTLVFAPIAGKNYVNIYGMDVTSREQAEQALRESEEKYRQLVETMNEGMGVSDENYIFTYANQKLCDMLGYTKDQIEGRSVLDFIHEDSREAMEEQTQLRKKGRMGVYESMWKTRDGRKIHMLISPKAFFDESGKFTGTLGVLTDITRRKQAEMERRKLLGVLALKNKELESILYIASHDLRSPLVNIQGFSYELARNCDLIRSALSEKGLASKVGKEVSAAINEGIPEALNYILAGTGKLDSLLLGLLRLSRLGRAALNIERLEMNSLLEEVVANMEYKVKEAGAAVELDAVPPCQGDYVQVGQVFTNLLDNALKYLDDSRAGVVHIYGSDQGDRSVYCVEDNGLGIAADHQGKIFETFHRLDPLKTGGEGLGLTIVRGIVERHEGGVWVESEAGVGSRFFVALPRV